MYKKIWLFISLLVLLILFNGCNPKTKKIEDTSQAQVASSVFDTNNDYTLEHIYPENTSKDQVVMSKKLYSEIDDKRLCSALEKYISNEDSNCENDSSIYDVKCSEYYNDFNGDGKNELFVYRSVKLPARTPDYFYRDLWYTDGETVEFVMDSTGREDYCGVIVLDSGPDLFYCVPDIIMGAPWQVANCYIVSDGKPTEYILPDKNQYFAFDKGDDTSNVYIGFSDDDDSAWEIANKLTVSDEPIQTYAWVDGEIKIVSGYSLK